MSLATFNPPQGPGFGASIHVEPQVQEVALHGGYTQVTPRLPRPLRRAELSWSGASTDVRDYIESFLDGLAGGLGPFWWTPFDYVASPTGMLPTLTQVAGGALGPRTYYCVFTWYDSTYGETVESGRSSFSVSANYYVKVAIPPIPLQVEGWRVYLSETSGSEKREATITDGSRTWTQSAVLSGSADPPSANTLQVPSKWIVSGRLGKVRTGASRWTLTLTLLEQVV